MIRSAKAAYYKNKLNDASDVKETWRTINGMLGRDKNNILPKEFLIDNEKDSLTLSLLLIKLMLILVR